MIDGDDDGDEDEDEHDDDVTLIFCFDRHTHNAEVSMTSRTSPTSRFNQSMEGVTMPSNPQSLTLG